MHDPDEIFHTVFTHTDVYKCGKYMIKIYYFY